VQPALAERSVALCAAVREVLANQPAIEAEEVDTAWREALRAQRSALQGLRRDGIIGGDVYEELANEVDVWLQTPALKGPAWAIESGAPEAPQRDGAMSG